MTHSKLFARINRMKKRKDRIKEASRTRSKRPKGSTAGKQMHHSEPDPWKELRIKLQPINKAYRNFKEKRRIAKQKDERRKLKNQEEQRLREEEAHRLKQVHFLRARLN